MTAKSMGETILWLYNAHPGARDYGNYFSLNVKINLKKYCWLEYEHNL